LAWSRWWLAVVAPLNFDLKERSRDIRRINRLLFPGSKNACNGLVRNVPSRFFIAGRWPEVQSRDGIYSKNLRSIPNADRISYRT
jgi:hypothetical protein